MFATDETFQTTSSSTGYTGYVAWDSSYLYVGMKGPDISSASSTKWFFVYLSGPGGTMQGVNYNTQTPTLPFPAKWHIRWKADNTYTNAQMWNSTSWADAGWNFAGNVLESGNFFEMRIPLANLGSPQPTSEKLVMGMLNEETGHESTYAGVPSTAYTDGPNPSFAHYFSFDLTGCNAPTSYTPQ